ncbi:putative DNA polymerase eta [Leishmania infantum JPCM5]|uniref:DNA polymerase eta n=2 Tax=Leishmania infantum TaxID=5671 RepID=A0A6L0XCF0_LEIIN|nr:putative DNA polymerase eta [Leishmania infantum JPCM5]CAC9485637.1 DNA_polymerase_eta_-_putative [Leishmania infantum]CAM67795.1 putative DNA polymerase eta [Leishmania infantum JPCM5]SUZ41525.1 DNA_polymerase_eta_-_putative [Leishmania infantum]|eukprot:XP_001465374.1 putative DNA polymerase eta [Leishmania infantum JPCM5]
MALLPSSLSSSDPMRCIAHIDMDCFYAQVEAVRLGVDCRVTPLALSQWGSLIAVNYPARARGVRRFSNVSEAQALCPGLIVALSPSYRMGESVSQYHPHPVQDSYKISLEPYRHASRQVFSILAATPGVQVEKGSVDEAYVDVTEAARQELAEVRAAAAGASLDPLADVMEPSTRLIEDRRAEMEAWFSARGTSLAAVFDEPMRALVRGECGAELEGSRAFCVGVDDAAYAERCLLLCAASRVVHRLRQRIYAELHYDCSAGIAHNRVLAKCISATHKPNQQTLLLPDRSASALFELPLSGLRGFGGKLGAAVSAVCGGVTECREAWLVPLAQLCKLDGTCDVGDGADAEGDREGRKRRPIAGKRGRTASPFLERDLQGLVAHTTSQYVFYRLRGLAEDTILNRPLSKTIIASKNFGRITTSVEMVRRWVIVLTSELCSRYEEFTALYHIRGRSFNIKLGNDGFRSTGGLSNHTVALPEAMQPDILAAVAMREVQAVFRNKPGAAADSVTLTIGGFVSDGSGATGSVLPLAATPGDSTSAGQRRAARGHLRQQTLLASFLAASATDGGAASAMHQRSGCNVAEVLSSDGNGLDDSDSNGSVHIEDDAAILSFSSHSLSSNGGGTSTVVLMDRTPPLAERDVVPETRRVAKVRALDVCKSSPCEVAGAASSSQTPLFCSLLPAGKAATEERQGESCDATEHHEEPQRHLGGNHHIVPQPPPSALALPFLTAPPSSPALANTVEVVEDNGGVEGEDGVTIID